MKEAIIFLSYLFISKCHSLKITIFYRGKRYRHKSLCGKRMHSAIEGNAILEQMIRSGKPFAAIRYGGTEMNSYIEGSLFRLKLIKKMNQTVADDMTRQSGFFPSDINLLPQYSEIVERTSREIDFLASYDTRMEKYMVHKFIPRDVIVSDNRALEPYYFQGRNPWSIALEGKKVLVIHPFAETIKKQYARREFLFEDPGILPHFELQTLKAVQTIVGTKDDRFKTWFEALDWMFKEAMKMDFEIAILGCGAYGQPLACMLKKAGKQAIHIGGATQILFGIKGKRWELNSPEVSALFNDYWVRPSESETPFNKQLNEFAGAYW